MELPSFILMLVFLVIVTKLLIAYYYFSQQYPSEDTTLHYPNPFSQKLSSWSPHCQPSLPSLLLHCVHVVLHLRVFKIPSGMVTPPLSWLDCSQCLTTLLVQKFFLMSNLNHPQCKLRWFPLVLSLVSCEERLKHFTITI